MTAETMYGLLVTALGIALAAWHTRGRGGRVSLHPLILKTGAGSLLTYALAALATAAGATSAAAEMPGTGRCVPIGAALVFIAVVLSGFARNDLLRELKASFENHRRDYPDLDDEALYRFVVSGRHPDWDRSEIQRLTEDCFSLDELAGRLEEKERAGGRP